MRLQLRGILLVVILTAVALLGFNHTNSFFNNAALSTQNVFTASISATPTPSAHLLISEVYYQVDPNHGFDSPNDRGAGQTCADLTVNNTGNHVTIHNFCQTTTIINVTNQNNATVIQQSSSSANTGNNHTNGNIGSTDSVTGDATATASMSAILNTNQTTITFPTDGGNQNDEWVELYNPTSQPINLKNWTLTDNSATAVTITANQTIPAHGFALLAKDAATFTHWTIPAATIKIPLGHQFGDGLDNGGDRLILKNPQAQTIDTLSYALDTTQLNPSIPAGALGQSLQRQPLTQDTNLNTDFTNATPTPGTC